MTKSPNLGNADNHFDELDRHILRLLQRDGRMPNIEIGRRVGVTEKTIRSRVARLSEKHGLRITANLSGARPTRMAFGIRTEPGQRRSVASRLAGHPGVDHIYMTTGAYDLLVLASFESDSGAFEFLTVSLEEGEGIRDVESCHLIQEAFAEAEPEPLTAPSVGVGDGTSMERFIVRSLRCGERQEVVDLAADMAMAEFGIDGVRVIMADPIGGPGHRHSGASRALEILSTSKSAIRGLSEQFLHDNGERVREMLSAGSYMLFALQTGQHLCIADAATDPMLEGLHAIYKAEGICSVVGLPLFHGMEVVGTISLYYRRPNAPSEEQLAILQAFADQVAKAGMRV